MNTQRTTRPTFTLIVVGLVAVLSGIVLAAGELTLVSVSSSGAASNGHSLDASISGDGRFTAFESGASNFVDGDTNDARDVFLHDLETGETIRVSVSSDGEETDNGTAENPSISADGRYIAFEATARNFVGEEQNGESDIFIHHRLTGITTRISVPGSGEPGNGDSSEPSLSADGRYVAFASKASNFVALETEGINWSDVFFADRDTDEDGIYDELGATNIVQISVNGVGEVAEGGSFRPSISADGRFIAFDSTAVDLVAHETAVGLDVFVHDRDTDEDGIFDEAGATELYHVSVDSDGNAANDASSFPTISADGRYVAFRSLATNLVDGDTNNQYDIFVHDMVTRQTTRVSVDGNGNQANGHSDDASISGDGQLVAFQSTADNLVEGDTNNNYDIFVHNRATGETTRISLAEDGSEGNRTSYRPAFSDSGRYVAFDTSSDLVSEDTTGLLDVYVYKREAGGGETADHNVYLPLLMD